MSKHLKRLAAPRRWTIPKKGKRWVMKPDPGAHALDMSLPLGVALRDYLGVCDTAREARRIIGNRDVLVDNAPATSEKRGIGLMDVLSIPRMDAHYRVLLDQRGRIILNAIPVANSQWKLLRLEGKTTIKGGLTQLNFHDGRNIVVKAEKDSYATGDTLKVQLPDQKILGHHPMTEGNIAMVTGGSHAGQLATVQSVEVTRSPKPNLVHLLQGEEAFTTVKPYAFVVGATTPDIVVPEVSLL